MICDQPLWENLVQLKVFPFLKLARILCKGCWGTVWKSIPGVNWISNTKVPQRNNFKGKPQKKAKKRLCPSFFADFTRSFSCMPCPFWEKTSCLNCTVECKTFFWECRTEQMVDKLWLACVLLSNFVRFQQAGLVFRKQLCENLNGFKATFVKKKIWLHN